MSATLLTATELTIYSSITASVQTIINKMLIETVEARLPIILNNYFTSDDICLQSTCTFNATANSITLSSEKWADFGFLANDPIFIYGSYRNDKYCSIASISDSVAVIASAYSVVDESFNNSEGAAIYFSLVKWPLDVKMAAAEMCFYDYEVRKTIGIGKTAPGIKSRSLGPWSESYSGMDETPFGYPVEIISKLDKYVLARLV